MLTRTGSAWRRFPMLIILVSTAFLHSPPALSSKKLLAGVTAVAVVASEPFKKRSAYKPPKKPTHIVESPSGNLTADLSGSFLCFATATRGQNYLGSDRAGAVFYSEGNIYFIPKWAYGRSGATTPAVFTIYPAKTTDKGVEKAGPVVDQSQVELWDCWSSKKWEWEDHALSVEALPQDKTPEKIEEEKRSADLKAGKIVDGPNNSKKWAERAAGHFENLAAQYPIYDAFWPAFDIFVTKVGDSSQLPNLSNTPFSDYCVNNLDRANNSKVRQMERDFGYVNCGAPNANWYKFLSWYHPAKKDFYAVDDWSHFGYYKPPQKQIFQQKDAIEEWYLGGALITKSYHYLFDFAERANMRVAGMVTGDGKKFASQGTFRSFVQKASAEIENDLFESVSNQRDIDENIRSWGLYPELFDFFVATLRQPNRYSDVIQAYADELQEYIQESAFEREYKYYFGAFILTEACYKTRGFYNYRKYVEKSEYKQAASQWNNFKDRSPLDKNQKSRAEQDVTDEYLSTLAYLQEEGSLDFNDETKGFCRDNYLALAYMPATSSTSEESALATSVESNEACDIARMELAEANSMDQLQLAKAKMELVCSS